MVLEEDTTARIKSLLKLHKKGLTISDISQKLKLNRNSAAKYLEIMQVSGIVEVQEYGPSKVYFLTHRIPISDMLSISSHLVLALDENHKIVFCNDNFLRFFSVERENLLGSHIVEICASGIRYPELPNHFSELLVNAGEEQEIDLEKDQKKFSFKIKGVPTVFEDGSRGITIVMRDVTLEKNLKDAKNSDTAGYDALLLDQTEFVVRFRQDGDLVSMNPALCRFFGQAPGKCLDRTFRSLVPFEDQTVFDQAILSLNNKRPVTSLNCRIIGPTGEIRFQQWTIRAIFAGEKIIEYQGVGRDITEQREAGAAIKGYIADQAFIYRASAEFAGLPDDCNIYETIGRGVRDILPDAIVVVNTFQLPQKATTRCFLGENERRAFSKYLGHDIVGTTLEASGELDRYHVIENLMGGRIFKAIGDLHVMMMGTVPKSTCDLIQAELNIGDMYGIGLVSKNTLLGNVILFLRKGDVLKRQELIETYIRIATVGLTCRRAEEALKAGGDGSGENHS